MHWTSSMTPDRNDNAHTHTRLMALFPGLPRWAGTRKVKLFNRFTEARDSEWQWHQLGLGHMQVCTSLQTDNHASTPPLSFFTDGCPSCRPTNSVKALKAKKHWRLPNTLGDNTQVSKISDTKTDATHATALALEKMCSHIDMQTLATPPSLTLVNDLSTTGSEHVKSLPWTISLLILALIAQAVFVLELDKQMLLKALSSSPVVACTNMSA